MRSQLIRLLLLCWLLALPLLVQAQDTPELDATLTIPDAAFSIDYPSAWELTEDEFNSYSLSSDDFSVLAILAYLPADQYAEAGSDLEAAHDMLEDTGLISGDPEALRLGGQDAVRSAGDSDALGGFTVNVIVETPNDGVVFVIAVIFDEIEANEALLLAMHDTIRFDGDTPSTEDDPTPPVTRDVDIPDLDAVLDVPELGFSLRFPSDWATSEPDEFVYVLAENESDWDVADPDGLRATLIYVEDYAGNPRELIAQYLGADFYYSTRMAEIIEAGGSARERLRGVTANNATYRTMTVIELPAGDAYALIVDGAVRDKFTIVALSDAMLASVEIRDERTETPDDPETTTYDLSETFEIPEAGFRMAYPDGWIEQENAGVYALAENEAAIVSQTLDAPVILILYSPPADYETFGGTLEDFGSLLFGLINARDYEEATVDGRDALLVRGPFVNTETQGYGVSVVFNSGDGGGLLILGAVGEDRAEELEALFAAMVETMQVTDDGL